MIYYLNKPWFFSKHWKEDSCLTGSCLLVPRLHLVVIVIELTKPGKITSVLLPGERKKSSQKLIFVSFQLDSILANSAIISKIRLKQLSNQVSIFRFNIWDTFNRCSSRTVTNPRTISQCLKTFTSSSQNDAGEFGLP